MKRYTLLYIVGVLCTFMNLSWAYASNPVKEGNVITGHVIEKGSEAGIAYAGLYYSDKEGDRQQGVYG